MKNVLIALSLVATALASHANPTVEKNGLLTNKEGRTLYTFDKDSEGKSNCNAACLAMWPAFVVGNAALADTKFSIVKRDDGVLQWAYQGSPLYLYAGDSKAEEVNGDGKGGVWHVLRESKKSAATPEVKAPIYSAGY